MPTERSRLYDVRSDTRLLSTYVIQDGHLVKLCKYVSLGRGSDKICRGQNGGRKGAERVTKGGINGVE
jgi:hypothetical protein